MSAIPFVPPLDDFKYGVAEQLSPLVHRVLAENPNHFTYRGTGTYILGERDVYVIDPGPPIDSHRVALEKALDGKNVAGILITHCHGDHSPLSKWLHEQSGAKTFGFGPHVQGVDPLYDPEEVAELSEEEIKGETPDLDFVPTVALRDGERIELIPNVTVTAIHTPGHTSNHLCFDFAEEDTIFTGDHVMGWSTTVISPPDGNMADYMRSVAKVRQLGRSVWRPTHGNPITAPLAYSTALLAHRLEREEQVLATIRIRPQTIKEIVKDLYAAVDEKLHKAAARSVLAHLLKLIEEGRVVVEGDAQISKDSIFLAATA
jgi:glyoxylase-like metal-dependent hydrolase (beta-lactamase superfamily II)